METRLISFWNFGLSSDRGQINWHDDVTRSPQRNERLRTKSRKRTEKNFWIEGWNKDRFFIGKKVTVFVVWNSIMPSPWLSFLSHPKKLKVLRVFQNSERKQQIFFSLGINNNLPNEFRELFINFIFNKRNEAWRIPEDKNPTVWFFLKDSLANFESRIFERSPRWAGIELGTLSYWVWRGHPGVSLVDLFRANLSINKSLEWSGN